MLPRRPARTRRTSQIPLEGPPVVPPREDVGGGVMCGLLVAASTAPDPEGDGDGVTLLEGVGVTIAGGTYERVFVTVTVAVALPWMGTGPDDGA